MVNKDVGGLFLGHYLILKENLNRIYNNLNVLDWIVQIFLDKILYKGSCTQKLYLFWSIFTKSNCLRPFFLFIPFHAKINRKRG